MVDFILTCVDIIAQVSLSFPLSLIYEICYIWNPIVYAMSDKAGQFFISLITKSKKWKGRVLVQKQIFYVSIKWPILGGISQLFCVKNYSFIIS